MRHKVKCLKVMLTSFNLTNDKLKRGFDNHKALKLFIREPGTLIYVPGSYYLGLIIEIKMIKSTFYNTSY